MNDGISPTPASREQAEECPSIEDLATSFYVHIAHGDEKHRAWLKAEMFAWFRGRAHLLQAEMQKSDQVHFAANGDEAKSLQPLLDALTLPTPEQMADAVPLTATLINGRVCMTYSELKVFLANLAALGNRTPARQEERPDGQQAKNAARYEWLRDKAVWFDGEGERMVWCVVGTGADDCHPCEGEELDGEIDAALRASSAPTTKG